MVTHMTNAERMRIWRRNNPGKETEYTRRYRAKHHEQYNNYMREYMRRRRARQLAEKEEKA